MKIEILRDKIKLMPENPQDRAYLEDTLNLKEPNDFAVLRKDICSSFGGKITNYYIENKTENEELIGG